MSTLKVENLLNKDSLSNNIVLNSDGTLTTGPTTVTGSQATVTLVDTDRTNNTYSSAVWGDQDANLHLVADYEGTAGNRFISLRVGGTSLGNEKMRINADGNVGIGTNNPSYPLDVDVGAPAATDKTIARFSSQAGIRDIGFVWDDSASTMGIATLTNHNMVFHTNGNSNPRMIIDTSGYVTTPSQPAWFYAGGTALTTSTYVVTKPGTAYISSPHYNTSTGLFTAPISGNYLVGVEGLVYPHGGSVMTNRWQKNGGQYGQVIQSGGENNNHTHLSWTQLVYLSQNDTIGFAINRSGSTEEAYSSQWHQWGYLVG
jgi:hypothetical protein